MINAAIVGLGWWGKTLVESVQDQSDEVRFVAGVTRTISPEVEAFAADHALRLIDGYDTLLADPEVDAVRLRWGLDGTHGMGPMLLAQEVAANRRRNRTAALAHLVAAFAWGCPANFATGAYKACSPEQRAAADAAINEVIAECDHLARLPLALGE